MDRQASRNPLGTHPLDEIANPLTVSRENSTQGISAGFRQFPPDRAVVKKTAISEGLEISGISGISAAGFAVSAKGCAPAQSPAWRMRSPAASSVAAGPSVTSGIGGAAEARFAGAAGVLGIAEGSVSGAGHGDTLERISDPYLSITQDNVKCHFYLLRVQIEFPVTIVTEKCRSGPVRQRSARTSVSGEQENQLDPSRDRTDQSSDISRKRHSAIQ